MGDIEDVGLDVRTSKTDSFFNVKVRSKIPKRRKAAVHCDNTTEEDNTVDVVEVDKSCCGNSNCCKDDVNKSNCETNSKQLETIENEITLKMGAAKHLEGESDMPWRCSIYLRTWGCSHNNSDSEYMGGLLLKAGYTVTADSKKAELWLLNSCTVKTPSETQLSNQVKIACDLGKYVVVAGCVSQAAPSEPWLKGVSIIGVQQIDRIVEVVDETLKGNVVRLLSARRATTGEKLPLDLPKMRRNEFVEILAINSGCLNHCTYCKTKQARGDLRSFELDVLVERARSSLVDEKCRELWLTSEDLGAWGRDIGMVLPDLLQALVKIIPDDCMMRLGMTNPPYILDHLEEIAEILCHPRVYSFLHIPVQSGSDAVLGEMKREYTREHFCRIVDYMIEHVPDIYIATDFICAFPTETVEDFQDSLSLVEKYKFPSLFINQYYSRPGTPAARLKKIETGEARRRTGEMTKLFRSYSRYNTERVGTVEHVLICEMATDGLHYVGHNKSYEHILVAPPEMDSETNTKNLLGKWAEVHITEVAKFYMKAQVIACNSTISPVVNSGIKAYLNEARTLLNKSIQKANPLIKIIVVSQALTLFYFIVKFVITTIFAK